MDRRDFAGILFAAIPLLGWLLAERVLGPPMDALIESEWAPFVVALGAFLLWMLYVFGARRILGPTRKDYQDAFEKMLAFHYKEDADGNPRSGISGEGIIREHAPDSVREFWYSKFGLGKPPRRPPY